MSHLRFDSRNGWIAREYLPTPCRAIPAERKPANPQTVAIESRCFFVLLDQARAGNPEAQAELKTRGQNMQRKES